MRSDSAVANITSKIIAAMLSLLLLLFSLAGPIGVITRAYAGTDNLAETTTAPWSGASYTHHAPALVPEDATPTGTSTPTNTPTPVPTTPTPTPTRTPKPTPTHTPKPTPTRTPTPTPAPGKTPTPSNTPTPGNTVTPQVTGTATLIPATTSADQTPTSTPSTVPVTNNNGGTPPGTQTGGGLPFPFISIMASALLVLGLVLVIGFVFLRRSLSPVPHVKLRPSGAPPWSRLRGHSLHGNTNMNGVPLIIESEQTTTYNRPLLLNQGGAAPGNQPQVPFGNTLPPANPGWLTGDDPANVPQSPFSSSTSPQTTIPQSSFLQQESGPIRFRAAGDNNTAPNQQPSPTQDMQTPARNAPSQEQLRRLAQQRLIVPPEQTQNEDWVK
jgi:outer membrane biosynthesis protein TonB